MPLLSSPQEAPECHVSLTEALSSSTRLDNRNAAGRLPLLEHCARRLVHRRLAKLAGCRLSVEDAFGDAVLGTTGPVTGQLFVRDQRFYRHVLRHGSVGLGEAYIEGWWTTPDLAALLSTLTRLAPAEARGGALASATNWLPNQLFRLGKLNTRAGSRRNIHAHYDLSNEFFAAFLDPTMTYSCGLFSGPETSLEEASLAKYDRICRQLDLQPGDEVAEIGCGWGGFAEYAARHYGCRVTGVTVSQEQLRYARQRTEQAGLADRVDLRFCDYRDLTGRFDKLVSIEMIEAVGHRYLPRFFAKCSELLHPHGKMMLQAITIPDQRYRAYRRNLDFIQKYVFPGGCLPSLGAIQDAVGRRTDLRLLETIDFAGDYQRTLLAWRGRFQAAASQILALGFDQRFLRLWDYYLCYCAAGFDSRMIGLAQLQFAKPAAR